MRPRRQNDFDNAVGAKYRKPNESQLTLAKLWPAKVFGGCEGIRLFFELAT
jgi:hypothetical protein